MNKRPHINGKPVVRCSELGWLLGCPGSPTLVELIGLDRGDDDRDSWDGQWAHYEAATRLVKEHYAVAPEGGLPPPRTPASYQPPDFMRWVVDFYVRTVLEDAGADRAIEVESELLHEFPRFWLSGHCDYDAINADATELNFDDLKSGINPVDPAAENWQVLGYAVLFKCQWPTLRKIRGRIIQPRLAEAVGERVTGVVFDDNGCHDDAGVKVSPVTIDGIAAALEEKINYALDNPRIIEAGIKQCRWCPAKLKCPALDAEEADMKKILLTDDLLAKVKNEPNDEALGRVCVSAKLLTSRFEKAKELMKERLETEKLITLADGTRIFILEVKGSRTVSDVGAAWEKLTEALDAERAYSVLKIGIEDAEKALAKQFNIPHKTEKKDKLDGRKMLDQMIGHLITRKPEKHLQIV